VTKQIFIKCIHKKKRMSVLDILFFVGYFVDYLGSPEKAV